MKILVLAVLILFQFLILTEPANAAVTTSSKTQKFINSNCELKQSCELKSATLTLDSYTVNFKLKGSDRHAYGSRMYFNYETDQLAHLENYGVVQMIRGCQFTSELKDGKIVRTLAYGTQRDDTNVRSYPEWAIDGYVKDPIEWGSVISLGSRHNYYWNHFPGSTEPSRNDYFRFVKPLTPVLWLRDLPGAAQYFPDNGYAHNFSFQFKTCVFKTADVPRTVDYANVDFAKPIKCFSWNSSFIYNHTTQKFDSPDEIDPFCLDKSNASTTREANGSP